MPNDLPNSREAVGIGVRSAIIGMCVNALLATAKAIAGVLGSSQALVADAIESGADVLTSGIVLFGVKMAGKPADENHPYGHGKYEPLAGAIVSLALFAAAILIAVSSIESLQSPERGPAPFTLLVLVIVIVSKQVLFRVVQKAGENTQSSALKSDAQHHMSDAITSAAAFVGISISIIGGKGYESADSIAALLAAFVIAFTGVKTLKPAFFELIDTAPDPAIAASIRLTAASVPGVLGTHKCHVRKVGFDYFVDLDILCDPEATIRHGHKVAHDVGEAIHRALPSITKVLVHVEPVDDYGRRSS